MMHLSASWFNDITLANQSTDLSKDKPKTEISRRSAAQTAPYQMAGNNQWKQTASGALTAWQQPDQSGQAAKKQMRSWQQPIQHGQTGSWGQSSQNRQMASWGQSAQNGQGVSVGQSQWRQNVNKGQTAQNGQGAEWTPGAQQFGPVMVRIKEE